MAAVEAHLAHRTYECPQMNDWHLGGPWSFIGRVQQIYCHAIAIHVAWQHLWKKVCGMFGAAMTVRVMEDKSKVLLDSSHFRLPPQCNLFQSLIQSNGIQEGHLA